MKVIKHAEEMNVCCSIERRCYRTQGNCDTWENKKRCCWRGKFNL